MTRNGSNGDRINIKSGTAELLSASLDLSTYGTPNYYAPLVLQGYASAAGDGDLDAGTGIGEIDMQGNDETIVAAGGGIQFVNLHLHGTGSAIVVTMGIDQSIIACEVSEGTGGGISESYTQRCSIIGNHVHDTGGNGILVAGGLCAFNYLKNDGATVFTDAINCGTSPTVFANIISIDGASNGITIASQFDHAWLNNSVFSNGGTGTGILFTASTGLSFSLMNNLVEGFSGLGGIGIEVATGIRQNSIYAGNGAYNNTANYDDSGKAEFLISEDNEVLSASPFAKTGSDTFANRHAYFETVDVDNVHGGAYPSGARRDKGAVQHADPSGGAFEIFNTPVIEAA